MIESTKRGSSFCCFDARTSESAYGAGKSPAERFTSDATRASRAAAAAFAAPPNFSKRALAIQP